VILKEVARLNMGNLANFLKGNQGTLPQECLQALDVVLREAAARVYAFYSSSHFLCIQYIIEYSEVFKKFSTFQNCNFKLVHILYIFIYVLELLGPNVS
jgi:hypothetical protein